MNSTSLAAKSLAASLFPLSQNISALFFMDLPRYLSELHTACNALIQGSSSENRIHLQSLAEKLNLLEADTKLEQTDDLKQKFAAVRECLGKNPGEIATPQPPAGYEKRSLLQLESLLDAGFKRTAVDDGLLQHILGGHFGKGTLLEGYNSQKMLGYIVSMLEKKVEALKQDPLCAEEEIAFCQTLGLRGGSESKVFQAMRDQFKQANEIGKTLQKEANGSLRTFNEFYQLLSLKIDRLAEGEGFFFQGGWTAKDQGEAHAISLEVIKEAGSRLTFRVYNQGDGLNFHQQTIVAGKESHLPLTEIVHIPIKNFVRPSIVKAIYDLMHVPPNNYKWTPKDFYQVVLPQLGGELSRTIYTVEHLMETLDTGHCSFLSLTAVVFQHLQSPELYRRWEFELQLATLWNYFEQHQHQLGQSEQMRHLLQKSSEQMARTARDAFFTTNSHGHNIINLAEWTFANDKIRQIQEKIKESHEWYLQNDAKTARPPFRFQKGDLSWDGSTAVLHPELPAEAASQVVITHGRRDFNDPKDLREATQKFQSADKKTFTTFTSIAPFLRLKEAIQEAVLKMSMESVLNGERIGKNTYQPLGSREEVADTLKMLNDLGKQFLWASMNAASFEPDRAEKTRATDYLTMLKLLTLADAVSRKYAASYGDVCVALPNLYQWDMGYLLKGRSGASHVFDPKWEEEILRLRNYWIPNNEEPTKYKNSPSFFGLERFPASTDLNPSISDDLSVRHFHEKKDRLQHEWDGEIRWQDIEWAVQWIRRPAIAEKIRAFSSALAEKHPYEQALYFLADEISFPIEEISSSLTTAWLRSAHSFRPKIFPFSFLTLRELSFAADFLLKNRWDPESFPNTKDFQKGLTSRASFLKDRPSQLSQLRPFFVPTVKKEREPDSRSKINAGRGPYGLDGGQFLAGSQDALPKLLQNLFLEERSRLPTMNADAEIPFRRRTHPHALLHQSPRQVHKSNELTQEETREIISLSALPERQIVETLAYFKRHLTRLSEPSWQQLFRKLMFEPPLLLEKLSINPKESRWLLGELSKFCREGRRFYEELGEMQAVSLFLEAGDYFASVGGHAAAADEDFSSILPPGAFSDGLAECKRLLAKGNLSDLDRTALHLAQLQMFARRGSLPHEQTADLIAAAIWAGRAPLTKENPLLEKAKSFRDLPLRFQPEIIEALEKDDSGVLNAVASQILRQSISTNWRKEGLLYVSEDGNLRIDPFRSRLLEMVGSGSAPLPAAFREERVFNATRLEYGRQTEGRVFEGENSRKEKYRMIDLDTGAPVAIQREIGGKWHRYLDKPPESLPLAMSGFSFWFEDRESSIGETVQSAIWYPSRTLWASDAKTGKLLYEIEAVQTSRSVNAISYQPKKIHRLNDEGKRTGLVLANTLRSDDFLDFLKGKRAFEASSYVLGWVSEETRKIQRIELPRLNLSFALKGERMECEQMKGYFLSERQHLFSLGDVSHYLVLEKGGDLLVLFPRVPLMNLSDGSLITKTVPDRKEDSEQIPYFLFDVGPDGACKARSEEGQLYLAMVRLWEHDYKTAFEEMQGLGAQIRSYTEGEAELLRWIMNLQARNFDADPRALGIRQQAGWLLLKNKIDFGGGLHQDKKPQEDDAALLNELKLLSKQVEQKREQIPAPFLLNPQDEELLLASLGTFDSSTKQLQDRLNWLQDQRTNKDLAKKIPMEEIKVPEIDSYGIVSNFWYTLQHQWKWGLSSDSSSLLHSTSLSSDFAASYRNAYLAGGKKTDETSQKKLLSSLYKKVLQINPELNLPAEFLKKEILLALEMIVRGNSDSGEKASAALLLALLTDPEKFISPDWFEFLLSNFSSSCGSLIQLAKNVDPKLADYLNKQTYSHIYEVLGHSQRSPTQAVLGALPKKSIPLSRDAPRTIAVEGLEKSCQTEPAYEAYQECAAIDPASSPHLPNIAYSVDLLLPEEGAVETMAGYGEELSQIFNPTVVEDRVAKGQFEQLRKNLILFSSSKKALQSNFTAHSLGEIGITRGHLLLRIAAEEESLKVAEQALLEMANKDFSSQSVEQQKRQAALANGDREPLSTDEILYLFASQDIDHLLSRNRALTKEEARQVYALAQNFLLESSSLRYQKKLLKLIQNYEANVNTYTNNERELESLDKLLPELVEVYKKWQADRDKHWLWKAGDFLVYEAGTMLLSAVPAAGGAFACATALTNPLSTSACMLAAAGLSRLGVAPFVYENYFYTMEDYHRLYDRHGIRRVKDNDIFQYVAQRANKLREENKALLNQRPFLLKDLAQLERTERAYSPQEHPEYLVAEHFGNLFLRKEQVESLEKFDWKGGASGELGSALEIIMGFGKTSVLLPLMALRNADGEKFPLLVMPEALIVSMSKELQSHLKQGFNQLIEVFDFHRSPRLKLGHLLRIEARMLSAKNEKKAVLMSGASLQTFALLFLERFSELSLADRPYELTKELDAFRRIFSLLQSSADLTLDEMDLLLDVLKAHHFTLGNPEELPQDVVKTTSSLFEALMSDSALANKIRWNFDPLSTGEPFTQIKYEEFKPLLIRRIMEGGLRPEILVPFFAKATADQKRLVEIYLTAAKDPQNRAYAFVASTDAPVRNTLAVLKEQIHKLLPLTAKKQVDEHYGAIPSQTETSGNSRLMAIPYHGSNNPMIGSQFGTDLEILNYTIELHLAKGIRQEIVKKHLEDLREQFMEEAKPLEKSAAYKEFLRIGGKPSMNLLHLGNSDWEQITAEVNRNRKIQFEFLRKYILSEIKTYNRQLKTNAQIFPMMGQRIKGCSGTLWNYRTYPEAISKVSFSDTEAKTLMLLWENSKKDGLDQVVGIEHAPQTEGIRKTLEPLYQNFSGSFIDLGGLFRGLDNREVAKEILLLASTKNPSIQGVVFYDANDNRKVLVKGREESPISELESGLSSDQLCAFWDQKHTTGSDIRLHPEMKAYLTVSRSTIMRDLLQAAWRLRGLDKGQRVVFAVAKEEGMAIAETLKKGLNHPASLDSLSLGDILLFTKNAEAMRQGDDNLRSLRQKIDGALMKPLLDLLLDPEISWETLRGYSPLVEELFSVSKETDPFALYGMPEVKIDGSSAVEEERKRAIGLKIFERLQKDPLLKQKGNAQEIKKKIGELAEKARSIVPNQVSRRGKTEVNTEIQVETQLEVDIDTKKQTSAPPNQNTKGRGVVLWPLKNKLSKDYFKVTPLRVWQNEPKLPAIHPLLEGPLTITTRHPLLQASQTLEGSAPLVSVDAVLSKFLAPLRDSMSAANMDRMLRQSFGIEKVFDNRLLASLNYMPVYPAGRDQAHFVPFDEHQEVCRHALAVRNPSSGAVLYIMLGSLDALQWEEILRIDRDKVKMPYSEEVSLIHFDLGVIADGSKPVSQEILKGKNSPFHMLSAQAKFLSGELNNYTEEELAELRKWIELHGAEKLKSLFFDQILAARESSREVVGRSLIGKLLKI